MDRRLFTILSSRRPTAMAWMIGFALLVSVGLGCHNPDFRCPRLFDPGSEKRQQAEFTKFDPYADPYLGPEIEGGRPREYLSPSAESVQIQKDRWGRAYGY